MKRAVIFACVALAGCHVGYAFRSGTGAGMATGFNTQSVSVGFNFAGPSEYAAGAILVGVLLAGEMHYYLRMPDGSRMPYYGVPEPDPARFINAQDCTRPIDLKAGNLMCR